MATGRFENFLFIVTAPKRVYAVGEVVPMTFTVVNTTQQDITYNFFVAPPDGQVSTLREGFITALIERHVVSGDLSGLPPLQPFFYAAGETKSFALQWDQKRFIYDHGVVRKEQVPRGVYLIDTFLTQETEERGISPARLLGADNLEIEVR